MRTALVILLFSIAVPVMGQEQLVLLKRDRVIGRLTEGDYIYCKMKDGALRQGIINELEEFNIITNNDTIPFPEIASINLRHRRGALPTIGRGLITAGVLYFTIDQVNTLIVDGQEGIDSDVVTASAALVGTGLILIYLKSKYQRVGGGIVLRTIDYTSRFYKLN